MKSILLIDADSLLFSSCIDKKENTEDGKGFMYNLDDAAFKFEEKVLFTCNSLEEQYGFEILHTILFIEGYGNFRYSFNKTYKANRKDVEKPPLIKSLTERIISTFDNGQYSTFKSINVETDDSIAATYLKYHKNDYGIQLILASPDKDLKTIPCLLYDNYWSRNELMSISELDAKKNLYTQMLVGDAADNVKGINRCGKVGAGKIVDHLESEYAIRRAVYAKYKVQFKRKAREEYLRAWYSLQMNTENVNTPDLEYLMFTIS